MIRFPLTALLLAATGIAGGAQAGCPTGADMTSGVTFRLSTGETESFRRLDNGLIQGLFAYEPDQASRTLLARGIYLLEVVTLENGKPDFTTRTTYSFPQPPSELPLPASGGEWSVTAATYGEGHIATERQHYAFGEMTRQSYGACSYDMIPITIRYPELDDEQRHDVLHFLPELGLSYLAEFHDKDGSDIYDYISIETSQ